MTEIINGIETRKRGEDIEHRHPGREYWHPVNDQAVINEMNKRHDDNIIAQYPAVYRND